LYALKDIQKVDVEPGETRSVTFKLTKKMLEQINVDGESVLLNGDYNI
jgi:hypothetical protein